MFTKQIQTLVSQLRNVIPEPAVRAFEDILGNCDQTLEHRAPIGSYIDGRALNLPQKCFANAEPIAAVTASNPTGYFSSDTCTSNCVTHGLAFRAIGPSAMDETRISTLYVGSLLDLCGNPYATGSGSEPVRFKLTDITGGGSAANNEAIGKLVTWGGTAYATTGPDVAFIDWTANGEFWNRWADGWEGWAVAKADRPNVTIGVTSYTAYEVVYVESQTRFVEFTTTAAFAGGPPQTAAATVNAVGGTTNAWGASDLANIPAAITVVDRLGKAPGAAAGFTGLAIWDEIAKQYILVASSGAAPGDQLFRFRLTADKGFATASVAATLLDGTMAPIGGAVTVYDTVGEWQGLNGADGWCVLKSDTGNYEIVFLEGQSRWMPFTLTANMAGGSAAATAGAGWGRPQHVDDPSSLTVYDTKGLFPRASNTAEGLAVWNDRTDKYEVVECESKAGAVAGTFSAPVNMGDSTVAISVTDYWGTQQDTIDPGTITAEVRSDRYQHWSCPTGGKAVAVYDALDDKYVVVDGEKVAASIEFSTGSAGFGAAVSVDFAAGGEAPSAPVNVIDSGNLFPQALSGASGVAIWRDNRYTVVECETKAGEYAYTTKTVYPTAGGADVQSNAISYWGTQQDVQTPSTTQTVTDIHGEWYLSRDGAKGYAIYDNSADKYKAVWQETYAEHIRYRVEADFTSSDADFDVTVLEFHSGQDPTGATTIKVRNVSQRNGTYSEEGNAYLDTINSTPDNVVYIDLEPGEDDLSFKIRWGQCTTNWKHGTGTMGEVEVTEVADRLGTAGGGSYTGTVYLPIPGPASRPVGHPNLIVNDIIAFAETTDGTFVCVSDYLDDPIGTVKMWLRSISEIPQGWAIMDGIQNSSGSGGSSFDTIGMTVRSAATADSAKEGRDSIPPKDLEHRHQMSNTANELVLAQIDDTEDPGAGLTQTLVVTDNICQENIATADHWTRDGENVAIDPMLTPSDDCSDPFGPINIVNENFRLIFIERMDNAG